MSLAGTPGCAPRPPPDVPPFAGAPAAPVAATPDALPPVSPAPPLAPPPAPSASLTVSFEAPFRLDRRVIPRTKEAFLADLAERTRWNRGDLGKLVAEPPPVPGHPAPKVILEVAEARGPLSQTDAQRVLRAKFWIKAVECFSLGAYKDQALRGAAALAVSVAANGHVASASVRETTFADDDVNLCLLDRMRGMSLPRARAGSRFRVELQIGHGDEPVPPPASLVVAGEGELTPEVISGVIEAARPAFEGCYREAFAYAPELWGRLGIRFHVTEKGKTDEAYEAESRFPDERVTLCVLRAARRLKFPKPTGGDLRFIVPLRFKSDRSVIPS
jgi:hypothetical protein